MNHLPHCDCQILSFHSISSCYRAKNCILECCTLSRLDRLGSLHSLEQMLTPFKIPQGWPADMGPLCPYVSGRLFGGNLLPFKTIHLHMGTGAWKNALIFLLDSFKMAANHNDGLIWSGQTPYATVLEHCSFFVCFTTSNKYKHSNMEHLELSHYLNNTDGQMDGFFKPLV